MKRIKHIAIEGLAMAAFLLGVAGCSNLDELVSSQDGEFILASSQSSVSVESRASSTSSFAKDTRYYLYALNAGSQSWSENYLNDPKSSAYNLGTDNGASIDLAKPYNNKFSGNTYNFYGVTESSTAENQNLIPTPGSGNTAPKITVRYADATSTGLHDVMWTQKLGQNVNNAGTIELPFEHTLSRLDFYVQKYNYTSDISIKSIEVCDYASGSLDIASGSYTGNETRSSNWYSVFTATTAQLLTADSKPLTTDGSGTLSATGTNGVHPTVFPTRSNNISDASTHSLGLRVTLSTGKVFTYYIKEAALNGNGQFVDANVSTTALYKPFQFKRNYKYDVQLTITADAMVVTVLPRYYGWLDVNTNVNNDFVTEIGNPVTFGGVVWADRNLGATSADPTRSALDWEKARGWYYQFGRSIPYYIESSMQDPNLDESSLHYPSNVTPDGVTISTKYGKPYPYVTGQFSNSHPIVLYNNKVYDVSSGWNSSLKNVSYSTYTADKLALKPGDTGLYNYVFDLEGYDSYPTPSKCPFDWDQNHTTSETNWNNPINQPCPKGWRLPTVEECLTIMPCDPICGDISFNPGYNKDSSSGLATNIPGYGQLRGNHDYNDEMKYVDKYAYKAEGLYLDYPSDEHPNRDGVYVGVKESGAKSGIIYCIKHQGQKNAYRIKWEVKTVNGDSFRQVLVVSRYSASAADNLMDINTKKPYDLNNEYYYKKYDWDHPSEQLFLPLSGMVYGRYVYNNSLDWRGVGLIGPGSWFLYWTATPNTDVDKDNNNLKNNSAYSMRTKVNSDNDNGQRALFTFGYDHRGFGGNIRCVRDDSVVK